MRKNTEDFWKSVVAISDEQRKLPKELRSLAGVAKQPFNANNLPDSSNQPESVEDIVIVKIKPICEFCPGSIGEDTPAEFLVPQSVDLGQTIEWKFVCFSHYDNWWDGADWEGTCFELQPIGNIK